MVPQPSAACVEVFDVTSAALPAAAAAPSGARWGAGKSHKGRGANAPVPAPAATGGQIQQLKEMGFSEKQAREALAECVWDVNKALDLLFTRGAPMNGEGEESNESGSASAGADASDGKGAVDSSAEACRSPDPSGKAGQIPEGAPSSGNSPGSADSTEQSTTASTASSPRSSGCIDKSLANSVGVSAPLSPQSPTVASVEEVEEEEAPDAIAETPTVVSKEQADAVVADKDDVCTDTAPAEEEAAPLKRLTRISKPWEIESADAQLSVKEGDFVCVWQSTVTEHGWIYAEDPTDAELAGWLPDVVLEELPCNQRWMKASQDMQAAHETALSVREGSIYKVNVDTRTKEGWIYAETPGVITEDAPDGESSQAGWVPVFCLEGADLEE